MSADPPPKSRDITTSPEYEPMDEGIPAPQQCPVHKKYDRQPIAVRRYPDESTVEYEPMDEGIPAPHQCPVQKKDDPQPIAVDRPQGYPDDSTVDYEPMDEDILLNGTPQRNIRQGGVLQRTAPHGNVNPQKRPENGSVGKDLPQNSPPTAVRGTVNSDSHQNTIHREGSHIYETLDRELPPSPIEYTPVYVINGIDEPPPDYDRIVSQQTHPHHQYQALNVGRPSTEPVLPVATTTSVVEQPKQSDDTSCCTAATTALVMSIIVLVLFGIYLIFLPLIVPALILAIVACKSETSKSCYHVMVGISITLSIITLCIALVVFYPAILFGVPIGVFVCVCQR